MNKAQKGFTLIELVVVITILGILAAFAFPRFAALEVEARIAATEGLAGSLRAGSALAHSMFLVNGGVAVVMEGQAVDMVAGYPDGTLAGITAALQDITGFADTYVAGPPNVATFETAGGTATQCTVTFTAAVAPASPTIGIDTSAC